jgi:hypothetical protein
MSAKYPEYAIVPPPEDRPILTALQHLTDHIRAACPAGAAVTFRFDGKLHADIDTRSIEQARATEATLAQMTVPTFRNIRPSKPPSAFLHRVTAEVVG